jgi:hypothetical protein
MGVVPTLAVNSVEHMTDEKQTAAVEAAQRVVDDVSSYQYSAEDSTIEEQLDQGLARARVSISSDERSRLLAEIEGLKNEQSGTPQVRSATPVE